MKTLSELIQKAAEKQAEQLDLHSLSLYTLQPAPAQLFQLPRNVLSLKVLKNGQAILLHSNGLLELWNMPKNEKCSVFDLKPNWRIQDETLQKGRREKYRRYFRRQYSPQNSNESGRQYLETIKSNMFNLIVLLEDDRVLVAYGKTVHQCDIQGNSFQNKKTLAVIPLRKEKIIITQLTTVLGDQQVLFASINENNLRSIYACQENSGTVAAIKTNFEYDTLISFAQKLIVYSFGEKIFSIDLDKKRTTLIGEHTGKVQELLVLGNDRAVSYAADKTMRIWTLKNKLNKPRILKDHIDLINMVQVTPNELAILSKSGSLCILNVLNGNVIQEVKSFQGSRALISYSLGVIVSVSEKNLILRWSFPNPLNNEANQKQLVHYLTISPTVVVFDEKWINLINKEFKTEVETLNGRNRTFLKLHKEDESYMNLHDAAKNNELNIIKALFKEGKVEDIDASDKEKRTALHYAAEAGHLFVVELLCHLGADLFLTDKEEKSALQLATENHRTRVALFLKQQVTMQSQRQETHDLSKKLNTVSTLVSTLSGQMRDEKKEPIPPTLSDEQMKLIKYMSIKKPQSKTSVEFSQVYTVPLDDFYGSLYRNIDTTKSFYEKRLPKDAFLGLGSTVKKSEEQEGVDQPKPISEAHSNAIWNKIKALGHIDDNGKFQSSLSLDLLSGNQTTQDAFLVYLESDFSGYKDNILETLRGYVRNNTRIKTLDLRPRRWYREFQLVLNKIKFATVDIEINQKLIKTLVDSFKNSANSKEPPYKVEFQNAYNDFQNTLSQARVTYLDAVNRLNKLNMDKDLLLREMRSSSYTPTMLKQPDGVFDFHIVKSRTVAEYEPIDFDPTLRFQNNVLGNTTWKQQEERLFNALIKRNRLSVNARNAYLQEREKLTGDTKEYAEKVNSEIVRLGRLRATEHSTKRTADIDKTSQKTMLDNWEFDRNLLISGASEVVKYLPSIEKVGRKVYLRKYNEALHNWVVNNFVNAPHQPTRVTPKNPFLKRFILRTEDKLSHSDSEFKFADATVISKVYKNFTIEIAKYHMESVEKHPTRGIVIGNFFTLTAPLQTKADYELYAFTITSPMPEQKQYSSLYFTKRNYDFMRNDAGQVLQGEPGKIKGFITEYTKYELYGQEITSFFDAAINVCNYHINTLSLVIAKIKASIKESDNKIAQYSKTIDDLRLKTLEPARWAFIRKWNSAQQVVGNTEMETIFPGQDPLTDFLVSQAKNKEKKQGDYTKKTYYFEPTANGFYNQFGESLENFMKWIAENKQEAENAVLVLPSFDKQNRITNEIIQVVTDPTPPNPHHNPPQLPTIEFVEYYSTEVEWLGYTLGELSHSFNLFPGEKKQMVVEKKTKLTQKTSEDKKSTEKTSQNITSSFEENLQNELSTDTKQSKKEDQKASQQQVRSTLDKSQSSRELASTSYSEVSADVGVNWGWGGASVAAKKGGTSSSKNTSSRSNEDAFKRTQTQESSKMNNQSKDILKKNVDNTIKKVSNKTSMENKLEFTAVSSEEYETTSSNKETITVENPNLGKTINYNFFQLQNLYVTATYLKDVKIVIHSSKELIAGTGIKDVRSYDLEEFGKIFASSDKSDYSVILATIVARQVMKHYANFIPKFMSGNGAIVLPPNYSIINTPFRRLKFASGKTYDTVTGEFEGKFSENDNTTIRFRQKQTILDAGFIFNFLGTTRDSLVETLHKLKDDDLKKLAPEIKSAFENFIPMHLRKELWRQLNPKYKVVELAIKKTKIQMLDLLKLSPDDKRDALGLDYEEFSTSFSSKKGSLTDGDNTLLKSLEDTYSNLKQIEKAFTYEDKEAIMFYLDKCLKGTVALGYKSALLWCEQNRIGLCIWTKDGSDKHITLLESSAVTAPPVTHHFLCEDGSFTELDLLEEVGHSDLKKEQTSLMIKSDFITQLRTALIEVQKIPFEFRKTKIITESLQTINAAAYHVESQIGFKPSTEPYLDERRNIETEMQKAKLAHLREKTKARDFTPTIPDSVTNLSIPSTKFFKQLQKTNQDAPNQQPQPQQNQPNME